MLYFAVQATLAAAWWITLWIWPAGREVFIPSGFPTDFLASLMLPDVVLFIGGSLVSAVLLQVRSQLARPAMYVTSGAVAYATLLCIGFAIRDGAYLAPAVMMTASLVCSCAMALLCDPYGPALPSLPFGEYRGKRSRALLHTGLQSAVFWTVFLVLIPVPIWWVEQELGWALVTRAPAIGLGLFLMAGSLGIWSGYTMARVGGGTPIPTASAPNLVKSGPYRIVRNPMAIAGLIQGVAVGLWLGSWLVWLYVLIGGVLWNETVRPAEEEDLRQRFGDEFDSYRQRIRCWLPSWPVGKPDRD